jgi:hypothetical protein
VLPHRASFRENEWSAPEKVETDVADLLENLSDMDDLVVQFDDCDAGKRFIESWKPARIIVDTGGGHGTGGTPPTLPPAESNRRIIDANSKRPSEAKAAFLFSEGSTVNGAGTQAVADAEAHVVGCGNNSVQLALTSPQCNEAHGILPL